MSYRQTAIVCLAWLLIVTGGDRALAQDAGAPAGVDPKADQILRRMGKTLADAREFSFEAHDTADQMLDNGQMVQVSKTVKIQVRRPDAIAADVTGDNEDLKYCYNGKALTIINRRENCHVTQQVPDSIDAMFDFLAEKFGLTPPLADLAFSDPYKAMTGQIGSGRYVGLHQVLGTKCHHLAFRQAGIDWQIWIEDSDRALPRKIVITYKELPGYPQFVAVLDKWDLKPGFTDATFNLDVPAGCRKVDLVPIQRDAAPKPAAAK